MKKTSFISIFFSIFLSLIFVSSATSVLAKIDLSISETDITFSKEEILAEDTVRIYARVFNTGDVDVSGFVVFSDNGKDISDPLPISVRVNTYDDVFIDWKANQGKHDIKAKIVSLNPADENSDNNSTVKKDIFVDIDTDGDGIGDEKDTDDDNDGLADEQEAQIGTNPKLADTDGDGISDKIDAFPKDSTESRDTDGDGLGDNKDLDDDGDGVFDDEEELTYGTNPLNPDTDSDGLTDKQEIDLGTNPLQKDTDLDGVNDSEDKYPLDPSKWQASLLDSLAALFGGNKNYVYWAMGIPAFLIVLFLFFGGRKRRRKRR